MSIYTGTPIQFSWAAGSTRPVVLDLSLQGAPPWQPGISVAANAVFRPTNSLESADGADHSTGYLYQNGATAGQTGQAEPAWPSTGTVADGSLTWTPVTPPASGEDEVASAVWTQISPPDNTLTITNEATSSLEASAYIGGGTAAQTYQISVAVTMTSGAVYVVPIVVTILPA